MTHVLNGFTSTGDEATYGTRILPAQRIECVVKGADEATNELGDSSQVQRLPCQAEQAPHTS